MKARIELHRDDDPGMLAIEIAELVNLCTRCEATCVIEEDGGYFEIDYPPY